MSITSPPFLNFSLLLTWLLILRFLTFSNLKSTLSSFLSETNFFRLIWLGFISFFHEIFVWYVFYCVSVNLTFIFFTSVGFFLGGFRVNSVYVSGIFFIFSNISSSFLTIIMTLKSSPSFQSSFCYQRSSLWLLLRIVHWCWYRLHCLHCCHLRSKNFRCW